MFAKGKALKGINSHIIMLLSALEGYEGVAPVEVPARLKSIKELFPSAHEIKCDDEGKALPLIKEVHSLLYVFDLKKNCEDEIGAMGDLNFQKPLWKEALNAVCAAVESADKNDFAAVRPPGHHAYKDEARGFCYLNNIVIASRHLLMGGKAKRIFIMDFDAHYGDGTHFLVKDDSAFLYGSVHGDPRHYFPMRRWSSDNAFLFDVEPSTVNDEQFLAYIDKLLERARAFKPDIIAISAGFDTWHEDPVLPFNIKDENTYYEVGRRVKALGIPYFAVLEGGYSKALPRLVKAFYDGGFA